MVGGVLKSVENYWTIPKHQLKLRLLHRYHAKNRRLCDILADNFIIKPSLKSLARALSWHVIACERLNTLNIQSHYFLFGGGSFYPLRVAPDVKTFFDRLRPPRTLTWCGQVFVQCGKPREPDPLDFSIFSWFNDTQL